MTDKLMYIPNNDTLNSIFSELQLLVENNLMNQPIKIQLKDPKV